MANNTQRDISHRKKFREGKIQIMQEERNNNDLVRSKTFVLSELSMFGLPSMSAK